jgi:hypothetical protein
MSGMVTAVPEVSSPPPDGTHSVDPARRATPVSTKGPALIVLGLAVFIVLLGVIGSALASGSSPTVSLKSVTVANGTVVHLTPATTAMRSIVSAGQPPADVLGNLAVPTGSRVVRTLSIDQNASQFDRTVYFSSDLSSGEVIDAYRALLPRLGWTIAYVGSGASRQAQQNEVLAKHGSGDGYYWEVGVVVSSTTSTGVTPYSVELFEIPDDN